MTDYPLQKPLVLVGMMGAGKSALGRRLADSYGIGFIDSDREITKAARMSISDIFDKFGEAEFRSGEYRVLTRIFENLEVFVLASGGGAMTHPDSRALLRKRAVSLWLDVPIELLWQRVKHSKTRPLLRQTHPEQAFRTLYQKRLPIYRTADIHVALDQESVEESHSKITQVLDEFARTQTLSAGQNP